MITRIPRKGTIATNIALPLLEIGCACGAAFALKVVVLARNCQILGPWTAISG